MGDNSPVKRGVYARWQGENEYFLIPPQVKAAFERTVYSLRRKKLFRFDTDTVTWMELGLEEKKFRLEKKEGVWNWLLPERRGEVSLENVSNLIYAFETLYIKEFLDGKDPSKEEFGFGAKDFFIAAGADGEAGGKIFLGSPVEEKQARFVFREDENLVVLVSEENLRSLVETFEVTFQELPYGDPGEARGDSEKNLQGGREGEKESE
jgi:hypothetical protein